MYEKGIEELLIWLSLDHAPVYVLTIIIWGGRPVGGFEISHGLDYPFQTQTKIT